MPTELPPTPGPIEATPEWAKLKQIAATDAEFDVRSQLTDAGRNERLTLEACGLRLDLTRQRLPLEALDQLIALGERQGVHERVEATLSGLPINTTEGRAVLHTALRIPRGEQLIVGGHDVAADVHAELDRMGAFAEQVRSGEWTCHDGSPVRTVVNIGIGGSNLGPQMATLALRAFSGGGPTVKFVSNVDPADLDSALTGLDPNETLFVICSKTFTTLETLTNAKAARDWLIAGTGSEESVVSQMVAVSTAREQVREFGIDPKTGMFGFWDWVGGRYSVGSAVGLSLMVAIGPEQFDEFLAGMHELDTHLQTAPPAENLAWLMALTRIWNGNLLGCESLAVLPYAQDLQRFPAYLQQLDMESNGKRARLDGTPLGVDSGPIVWGEPGTDSQHSFHQLLHQGTRNVPCDLIAFANPAPGSSRERHDLLVANLIAQAEALSIGRTEAETLAADGNTELAPHRTFPGGRPVTVLLADRLDPRTLGRLIALYEHKVLIEGALYGINPFDQWGVELGKELAGGIGPELTGKPAVKPHDPSTESLIKSVRSLRIERA